MTFEHKVISLALTGDKAQSSIFHPQLPTVSQFIYEGEALGIPWQSSG